MTSYRYDEPADWHLALHNEDYINYLGQHPVVMALQDDDRLSLPEQTFMVRFLDKAVPIDTDINELFRWLHTVMKNLVFEDLLPIYFDMLNPQDFQFEKFHNAREGCFTPYQLALSLQVFVVHLIAVTVSEELELPFEQVLDAFDDAEVDTYGIAFNYPRQRVNLDRFFKAAQNFMGR